MNFDTTLFIEYFINGGLAILWLIPLFQLIGIDAQILNLNSNTVLVSLALIYILGMLIDYLAAVVFRARKTKVRKAIFAKYGLKTHKYHEVLFLVNQSKNELMLKHLERRNSRVRYSRGALLNFIIATMVLTLFQFIRSNETNCIITGIALILVTLLAWQMWEKMLALSYHYQAIAMSHNDNKSFEIRERGIENNN